MWPSFPCYVRRCIMKAKCLEEARRRRRRSISSAVVDNVINTAEPVDNFVAMTTEVFGVEQM